MEEDILSTTPDGAPQKRRGPLYIEDGQTYPFETDNGLRGSYRPMQGDEQRRYSRELLKTAAEEDGTSDEREQYVDEAIVGRIVDWDLTNSEGKPVKVSVEELNRIPTERVPLVEIILNGGPPTPEWRAYVAAKQRRELVEAERLLDAGQTPDGDRFDEETVAGN